MIAIFIDALSNPIGQPLLWSVLKWFLTFPTFAGQIQAEFGNYFWSDWRKRKVKLFSDFVHPCAAPFKLTTKKPGNGIRILRKYGHF